MGAGNNQTDVKEAFHGYPLEERRSNNYTFTSMKGLIHYFSNWLDVEEIEELIEQAKTDFTIRSGISKDETKLQMIKKCEYSLVRILRRGNRD